MIVNIKPRVGIICDEVLIKYGMTRQGIQEAFGVEPAMIEIDNVMEEIREHRFGMVFTYEKEKLIYIEVSLNTKLIYKEVDIFGFSNSVELLSKYDVPTSNVGKYINFYKLGIIQRLENDSQLQELWDIPKHLTEDEITKLNEIDEEYWEDKESIILKK